MGSGQTPILCLNRLRTRRLTRQERADLHAELDRRLSREFPGAVRVRDTFLAAKRGDAAVGSALTADSYEADLRDFFAWSLLELEADPLTLVPSDVLEFRSQLANERSDATIRRRLAAISGFYKRAVRMGVLDASPAVDIARPEADVGAADKAIEADQLARLVSHAEAIGPSELALVLLMGVNGLRVSEACGARIEHLFTERGHPYLSVRGKGKHKATAALASDTIAAIERAAAGRKSGFICRRVLGSGSVEPYDRYAGYRLLARLSERAGLANAVTPHQLRHTFVTLALDGGIPVEAVSQHARHRSIQTTLRYDRDRNNWNEHSTHAVVDAIKAVRAGATTAA